MVTAEMTGDLATMLTPVLAALLPLVGNSEGEDDSESGIMDIDVNDAAGAISKAMVGFSGKKVAEMMKKLLITNKNIVIEITDSDTGDVTQDYLDMDTVNEIFCGEVQDMFILAFYVIRLNFKGFFKKLAGQYGNVGEGLVKKVRTIL
jgi:hypothetical protein